MDEADFEDRMAKAVRVVQTLWVDQILQVDQIQSNSFYSHEIQSMRINNHKPS